MLLLQGSDLMPKDWTGIIQAASKSPLGILALMILFLGVLGYVFFKDADAKIKAVMYLAMLGGVIGYDLVVSSESGPAKGVITSSNTRHVCYCHTPMRYLWDLYPAYRNEWTRSGWKRA